MTSIYARAYELLNSEKYPQEEPKSSPAKDLIEVLLSTKGKSSDFTSEDLTKIVVKLANMMKD